MSLPQIAVVSAGAMGAAVASRLTRAGCAVFTNLDGRSEATKDRARKAGMRDVPFSELAERSDCVLSILPPSAAFHFAETFVKSVNASTKNAEADARRRLVFADCNAVNPQTVKQIAKLFDGSSVAFIDAGIIGGPPTDTYNPTIYASVRPEDEATLDVFTNLSKYGLKIEALKGKGAGVGDASALKMSYAGITKGLIGVFSTMILAAHAASPATSNALLHELHASQPVLLQRITKTVPSMPAKAYRWVGEMEEIAGFVGEGEGEVYKGMAELYRRIEKSVDDDGEGGGDVGVLEEFVKEAKKVLEEKKM